MSNIDELAELVKQSDALLKQKHLAKRLKESVPFQNEITTTRKTDMSNIDELTELVKQLDVLLKQKHLATRLKESIPIQNEITKVRRKINYRKKKLNNNQ